MHVTTLIIGAGAAGMMCAAHAGPGVLVVDHAKAAGEKIRISGGGRCNFTNLGTTAAQFISANPHFAKSALSRYTQWDFIARVDRAGIPWHEKTLGQLFCDTSAKDVIAMLRADMADAGAGLWLQTSVGRIERRETGFEVTLERDGRQQDITCTHLVVASGGKSIPKMGATGLGYALAAQFGLPVIPTRPGLVPLTFGDGRFAGLSGVAVPARISAGGTAFHEALLFTHRGVSGPAVLQASSYWREGAEIGVDLDPSGQVLAALREARGSQGRKALSTMLGQPLPARLAGYLAEAWGLRGTLGDQSDAALAELEGRLRGWRLRPDGSEGYRTAEVTIGGVDTAALSSRTMEARDVPGLYFIGECVDVTGWLGGYNFQWAWSSGWAAGQAIAADGRR